jgi:hypothetical protein
MVGLREKTERRKGRRRHGDCFYRRGEAVGSREANAGLCQRDSACMGGGRTATTGGAARGCGMHRTGGPGRRVRECVVRCLADRPISF